jgi:hypothetical protein
VPTVGTPPTTKARTHARTNCCLQSTPQYNSNCKIVLQQENVRRDLVHYRTQCRPNYNKPSERLAANPTYFGSQSSIMSATLLFTAKAAIRFSTGGVVNSDGISSERSRGQHCTRWVSAASVSFVQSPRFKLWLSHSLAIARGPQT